jgi:1,4-dihydroxy-2-naphthoate octaprenyltransferase
METRGVDQIKNIFRSMRFPFLILSPVSIYLGVAASYHSQAQFYLYDLTLILVGAVAAHISVNTFNEYFDFHSGLDAKTLKTPFSGGSGALVEKPELADAVLYVAIASLISTILIGFYFIFSRGLLILPIGLLGVLIILTYTQWLNKSPMLCLLAPGIAFGPLMVVGTSAILTGEYSIFSLFLSLVPFLLASNLLLLNQFPDIDADKSVGRRHFPIAYGIKNSTILYGMIILAVCLVIVIGVIKEILPSNSLFALIPMTSAVIAFYGVVVHKSKIKKLIPYMGLNVFATIMTPLLLTFSIIYV